MADPEVKFIFDTPLDEPEEARLDAQAEAEIDAGRGIPHAKVRAWLESWGKRDRLPCPPK